MKTPVLDKPFRFLDLTAELRLQVYEYVLVTGKIFYTPDDYSKKTEPRFKDKRRYYRKPNHRLLLVCKQIAAEAEEVYLSKNLFVLPDYFIYREPINYNDVENCCIAAEGHIPFNKPLFSQAAARHLKNTSIAFNPRQPDLSGMVDRSRWDYLARIGHEGNWANMTGQQRLIYGHASASMHLQSQWTEMVKWLIDFLSESEHQRLSYIEIDIANAYCPNGCCRPETPIPRLLAVLRPAHVVIRGTIDEAEENDVMEQIRAYYQEYEDEEELEVPYKGWTVEQIRKTHNIEFDPKIDVWAWNKVTRKSKDKAIP